MLNISFRKAFLMNLVFQFCVFKTMRWVLSAHHMLLEGDETWLRWCWDVFWDISGCWIIMWEAGVSTCSPFNLTAILKEQQRKLYIFHEHLHPRSVNKTRHKWSCVYSAQMYCCFDWQVNWHKSTSQTVTVLWLRLSEGERTETGSVPGWRRHRFSPAVIGTLPVTHLLFNIQGPSL